MECLDKVVKVVIYRDVSFQAIAWIQAFMKLKFPHYNPNTFAGLVWKVRKKLSGRRKEGRVEKKSARSVPARPGARTRDLPRARRGSPAARQGGCLDKQGFPCL